MKFQSKYLAKKRKNSISREVDRFLKYGLSLEYQIKLSICNYLTKNIQSSIFSNHVYSNNITNFRKDVDFSSFLKDNPNIAPSHLKDYFNFLESVSKEAEDKEFYKEESCQWENFKKSSYNNLDDLWNDGKDFKQYINSYPNNKLNQEFFLSKIRLARKITDKDKANMSLRNIKKSLEKDWKRLIDEKIKKKYEYILQGRYEEFKEKQIEKMNKFANLKRLLSPFVSHLGSLWDMADNDFHLSDFNVLNKYSDLLNNNKQLQHLAEMLGKFRKKEIELEKEKYKKLVSKNVTKFDHFGKTDLVGIKESGDFNYVIPSEIVYLSDEDTDVVFYKKLVEKKLLTYEFISFRETQELLEEEALRNKTKENDKGPYIICVDTSGSMAGDPENIAKTIILSILKKNVTEKRPVFLISFSSTIETVELTNIEDSLEYLINFLKMSFYAGTDPIPALQAAITKLETDKYKNADVLFITDGEMPYPETMSEKVQVQKSIGSKFYSIIISNDKTEFIKLFDKNFHIDPKNFGKDDEFIKEFSRLTL